MTTAPSTPPSPDIASDLQTLASRARDGCLIYFTSHGTPNGMVMGDAMLSPGPDARHGEQRLRQPAQRDRDVVLLFRPVRGGRWQAENRIIMTAARPDRTSFGCGEMDHYTFFDDCFLRALPMAGDFPGLGGLVQQCVAEREREMKATPPSEPQVSVGPECGLHPALARYPASGRFSPATTELKITGQGVRRRPFRADRLAAASPSG